MIKEKTEYMIRLFIGLILNFIILIMLPRPGMIREDLQLRFILTFEIVCLSVVTIVLLAPVFWKGAIWQKILAFLLIFIFPGLGISLIIDFIGRFVID